MKSHWRFIVLMVEECDDYEPITLGKGLPDKEL